MERGLQRQVQCPSFPAKIHRRVVTLNCLRQMEKQGMKNFVKIAIVAAALVGSVQSQSFAANVLFDATVDNSCTISDVNNGTMVQDAAGTTLSSIAVGGVSGNALVTSTTTDFDVYTDAPIAWDSEPGTAPSTTFAASHSAYTPVVGAQTVDVDLVASAATSYPTGLYAATVVLRCE